MTGKIIPFPWRERRLTPEEGWSLAEHVLATSIAERMEKAPELRLDDPEMLLAVCEVLRSRLEVAPKTVREDAEFFYRFVANPKRKIGLFDEREYFMGELALIAGTACRLLFHREEARRWFDRSEASFSLAANSSAHVARLAYQRLALAAEERRFDEVLELVPLWVVSFERQELHEDALKCGFLESAALRETGRTSAAIALLSEIFEKAEKQRMPRLAATAATNLVEYYRVVGDLREALAYAGKALPLLEQLNNRVVLAKLRWSAGDILREQGKLGEAIETYRSALRDSEEIGMRGDQAALRLVLADVLLSAGEERQAEWEVRAALPIIDEEKMVPEGYAALTFLRNALKLRQVDRKALRELHGYFRGQQG